MIRRPCALALIWLAAVARPMVAGPLPAGDPAAEGFVPAKLDPIQRMIADAVARKKVAGVATLVARHGKVVHAGTAGLADVEVGRPLERSTLFRIASMTKPITSAAVMILVDDGAIRLDDPVSKYLPEFAAPTVLVLGPSAGGAPPPATVVRAERPITIHHLLTHSSGLSYRFLNPPVLGPYYVEAGVSDGLAETPGTIGDNVRRLARLPLIHQPGAAFTYSLSTDVLGRVVEVASGRDLDAFLRERLFAPLKMDDTSFLVPTAKRDRLAAVYMPLAPEGGFFRAPEPPVQIGGLVFSATFPKWDTGHYFSGGAGLTSTIDDYARFLQMVLDKGELDGVRVLKAATVETMTTDRMPGMAAGIPDHGDGFGYGFGVVRPENRYKDPAGPGSISWAGFFHTSFWADPKTGTIGIFMSQLAPGGNTGIAAELKRLTYEAMAR